MIRIFSTLLFLIVFVGFYLAFTLFVPETEIEEPVPEPEEWVMDSSTAFFIEEFEQAFTEGLNNEQIPGAAVTIVKDGRVIYQKGFGVKERGKPEKVDEYTVFRLGSLSKGFASVLTGLLVEEDILSWDIPITNYLNDFRLNDPEQTERVQIRHLLSHTSGLPRHAYTNLLEDGLSLDQIIPRLESVPLVAREGTQHSYQNAAFSIIEKIVENQTNTSYNALLQEKLFEPLAMNRASYNYDGIINSGNNASPHLYASRAQGRVPVAINRRYYNAVSSGGVNASASDMGNWLLLLTGYYPEIISEETLNEIFTPIATIRNRRFSRYWDGVNESYYAKGWRVLDNHGQRIVYHGGYVNGYRSEVAFAPEDGLGISILVNTNSGYALEVIPYFFNHFKSDSLEVTSN
ncbi:MAG: beta-lactamase family protein [Balneolaceae bacterium]|nr:beta-lactamase family protein [Balneolaceae bacterium]